MPSGGFYGSSDFKQRVDIEVAADPTGTLGRFLADLHDVDTEIAKVTADFRAGRSSTDEWVKSLQSLTAQQKQLKEAVETAERAIKSGTAAGANFSVMANQGTQALQGFSRGFEDLILSGGRWSSVANNAPQMIQGIAGAMGLGATQAVAWAAGIGIVTTAAIALAPAISSMLDSFRPDPIDDVISTVDRLDQKIEKLKDQKIRTAVDDAELERLIAQVDRLRDGIDAYNRAVGKQTVAEGASGKAVATAITEAPGGREAIAEMERRGVATALAGSQRLAENRAEQAKIQAVIAGLEQQQARGGEDAQGAAIALGTYSRELDRVREEAKKITADVSMQAKAAIGNAVEDASKKAGDELVTAQSRLAKMFTDIGRGDIAGEIKLVSPAQMKALEDAKKKVDEWKDSLVGVKEVIKDIPLADIDAGAAAAQAKVDEARRGGQAAIAAAGPLPVKELAKLQKVVDQGVGGLDRDADNRVDAARKKAQNEADTEREKQINGFAQIYKAKLRASADTAVANGIISGAADADTTKAIEDLIIGPAMAAGGVPDEFRGPAQAKASADLVREAKPKILAMPGANLMESARAFLASGELKRQREDERRTPDQKRIEGLAKTFGAGGGNAFAQGLIATNENMQLQFSLMAPDEQRAQVELARQQARMQREDERRFQAQLRQARLTPQQRAGLIQQRRDAQAQQLPGVPLDDQALGNIVSGRLADRIAGQVDEDGNPITPDDAAAIAAQITQNQGARFNARAIGGRLGQLPGGRGGFRSVGVGPDAQGVGGPAGGGRPDDDAVGGALGRAVNVGAQTLANTGRLLAIVAEQENRLAGMESEAQRQAQAMMQFNSMRTGRRSFGRTGIR